MQVGGVQKSLCNLFWTMHDRYEVTLYLFSCCGEYMNDIPQNVKVIECSGLFRFLGVSQGQCHGMDQLKRGFLVLLCRIFGRRFVLRLLLAGEKKVEDTYDCAIAYLQNKKWIVGNKAFQRKTDDKTEKIASLAISAEETMAYAQSLPKI